MVVIVCLVCGDDGGEGMISLSCARGEEALAAWSRGAGVNCWPVQTSTAPLMTSRRTGDKRLGRQ